MVAAIRQAGFVTVVDVRGNIVQGKEIDLLRSVVKGVLNEGHKKILFNLGNVNYIDTSGIGCLMSAFTSVRRQAGELKFLNPSKKVRDVMQTTRLDTIFDVLDDEVTALRSFSQSNTATPS
jgi:anti-sigma B factor antagonist